MSPLWFYTIVPNVFPRCVSRRTGVKHVWSPRKLAPSLRRGETCKTDWNLGVWKDGSEQREPQQLRGGGQMSSELSECWPGKKGAWGRASQEGTARAKTQGPEQLQSKNTFYILWLRLWGKHRLMEYRCSAGSFGFCGPICGWDIYKIRWLQCHLINIR